MDSDFEMDWDGDGHIDSTMSDLDGDGLIDQTTYDVGPALVDADGDGFYETTMMDAEIIYTDHNADGIVDDISVVDNGTAFDAGTYVDDFPSVAEPWLPNDPTSTWTDPAVGPFDTTGSDTTWTATDPLFPEGFDYTDPNNFVDTTIPSSTQALLDNLNSGMGDAYTVANGDISDPEVQAAMERMHDAGDMAVAMDNPGDAMWNDAMDDMTQIQDQNNLEDYTGDVALEADKAIWEADATLSDS